jgi:tyrosine-protein kinase Etk/Wzc
MAENKIIEPTIFTSNKLFIQQLLSFKYFYIGLTFFSVLCVYLYNKVASTEYEVYATISATKDETSSMLVSSNLFNAMQPIQSYSQIEDGINKLRSYSTIYSTIEKLNLKIGYFREKDGPFKIKNELYLNSPFTVNVHKSHIQPIYIKLYIDLLSDSTFRISAKRSNVILFDYINNKVVVEEKISGFDKVFRFSEEVISDYLSLSVDRNKDLNALKFEKGYRYYFELYNPELMAKQYGKNLTIRRVSPSSSLLIVSLRGENLTKTIFFVNNYLNDFFEESLRRKNTTAINTINFIDSQIAGLSDSLVRSESVITSFRSTNQVMNLNYQGQKAIDDLQRLEKERTDLLAQERYYGYILNYLKTTQDVAGIVPPSGMNVDNSFMNQLITDLLKLNSDRSNIINLRGEKNLFLAEVENKIKLQKQYIIEIASNSLNTVKQSIVDLDAEANKLTKEISALPKRELNMGNIQRRFNIDESIYSYLLQKRSEATITMASNNPDFELIEPARIVTSYQVKPKYMFNYLIALILGMVLPTGMMILKNLINFKITNPEYIQQVIKRSPIATIYSQSEKKDSFIIDNPNSISTENFRALRSIVFRKLSTLKSKVIVITSAQPQDGKSFISYNLAHSIAMVGKETLIIDGDLKRPTLHKLFNTANDKGITNLIIENVTFDEVIYKTKVEQLSFVPAGPFIPNATEIIESGGLDGLIKEARKRFEYIIIDTSPIGLMTDAMLLTRYSDYILISARNNSTNKDAFLNVLSTLNSNGVTNYDVVFNDMNLKDSSNNYARYYGSEKRKV